MTSMLAEVGKREMDRLISTGDRLLAIGTVIAMNLPIFRSAMGFRTHYGLSEQDATVYASVLSHLAQNPNAGPHLFISRDKDFSDPEIASELGYHGCTFVPSFIRGAELLDQEQVS